MTKIQGGYVLISVGQFANVCAAKREGEITFLALRVWLAAHEQRAKRCQAKRVRFTATELAQIVRENVRSVERALKELSTAQLLSWSETAIDFPRDLTPDGQELAEHFGTSAQRPVPVPRQILRALFRHKRPSEVLAAIGHLIRCLFISAGKIRNGGLVKASWVSSTFGVAERSVHAARKWLSAAGFLVQESVHQLVMNRWGGKFLFETRADLVPAKGSLAKGKSAPPSKTTSTSKSTSNNQINYKPARAASGVQKEPPPTLKNIRPEDLRKPPRLESLYRQAVQAGWIEHSEASIRNFASAAVRATRAGGRVGAIFAGIVKRGLWHHITQEQETRATAVLRQFRERNPSALTDREGSAGTPSDAVMELLGSALGKSRVLAQSGRPRIEIEAARRKALRLQTSQIDVRDPPLPSRIVREISSPVMYHRKLGQV